MDAVFVDGLHNRMLLHVLLHRLELFFGELSFRISLLEDVERATATRKPIVLEKPDGTVDEQAPEQEHEDKSESEQVEWNEIAVVVHHTHAGYLLMRPLYSSRGVLYQRALPCGAWRAHMDYVI